MGLLDGILGAVIGRVAGGSPGLQTAIQVLLGGAGAQNLGGLWRRFQQHGYGDVMNSWIGTGRNQPISPEELQEALGRDRVQDMSERSGLPIQELLALLARYLPEVIDRLTPNGRLPQGGSPGSGREVEPDDAAPGGDEPGEAGDEPAPAGEDEAVAQARRKLGGDDL